jgi:hypothetical protein
MAYNSIINGGPQTYSSGAPETAQSLIPLEYANEIVSLVPAQSVALKSFRRYNMGHSVLQIPVLDALPSAEWVSNQGFASPSTPAEEAYGALEETTEAGWKGVQLTAETLAVNVPISRITLADSGFPIWSEVVPLVAGALARKLDASTLFGYSSPFTAPALVPAAVAAGQVETKGTHTAEEGGLAHDVSQLFNAVEAVSGFNVTNVIASKALRYAVRNARTTIGSQIPIASGYQIDEKEWYGVDVDYNAAPGLWPGAPATGLKGTVAEKTSVVTLTTGETTTLRPGDTVVIGSVTGTFTITKVESSTKFAVNHEFTKADQEATAGKVVVTSLNPVAILGDFAGQAIIGVRQDLEFQMFNTGVITNKKGEITQNLMTQDMVNLRVTARYGYAVANSVTYYHEAESGRYPFGVLLA